MQTLLEIIKHTSQTKELSFKEFMALALYSPSLGYYTNERRKIGRTADFITAPTLGSLFANCLAQQLQQLFTQLPANFIEYGAGTGQLAADLSKLIDFNQYIIIEISPSLKAAQHAYVAQHSPQLLAKIKWLDEVPQNFIGVIFGNEVIDAFPVHKFCWANNILQEFYVKLDNKDNLTLVLGAATPALEQEFSHQGLARILGDTHYVSEVNTSIRPWLSAIAANLTQGVILLCDYGFERAEYFHPMRNMGTLIAHHQQRTNHDLLAQPGEQDLTAHVDFTSIAEATLDTKLELLGYTNLASFLLNCNILEHYKLTQKIDEFNLLTSPSEMGELFKIIALGSQVDDLELQGFKAFDYSYKL